MRKKTKCSVYLDGSWRRGTLEWLTPTEENSSLKEAVGSAFGWTSNNFEITPGVATTSNKFEINYEAPTAIGYQAQYNNTGPRVEVIGKEDIKEAPLDAVLDLASDARLKAAAFYERWAFWIMVGGSVVGGGWISSYFKMALWHVGQFLVKLN